MKEQATQNPQPSLRTKLGFGAYDFSNSGYVLMFQSFLFPLLLADAHVGGFSGGSLWGGAVALSTLVAIVLSPFVGLAADKRGRVVRFSVLVLVTGIGAGISGYLAPMGALPLVLLFIVFNGAFELTQSLYDSFLKDVAVDPRNATHVSAFAWGFGYVGGAVVAVIYLLLEKAHWSRSSMLLLFAGLYVVLSVPAIRFFRRRATEPSAHREPEKQDRRLPRSPVALRKLAVYWLIAESVGAVAYFAPLYLRQELLIGERMVGMLLLAAQIVAFPLTVASAYVSERVGQRRAIRYCLVVWLAALMGLYAAQTLVHVIGVMFLVSMVIGSTQAILRAHYAGRVHHDAPSEGFGFYAVAQKSAAVLGPALVSLVTLMTGALRPAFLVLAVLVAVAILAVRYLPEEAEA